MGTRKYNAEHLSTSRRYQLQQTNWYEINIGGLGEDLTFLVTECSLPERSNPANEIQFGNSKAKIAGPIEYGEGSLSFMDAIVADIEKQLVAWQDLVQNQETGKMGWVDEYKKQMTVTQYGPDGTHERVWTYKGCWPSSINYGSMSNESPDKKIIQVTISYDSATRS